MPTCPARRNLPLALALAGGLLLAAAPCRAGVDCGGTLQAWRQDAGMRQYMQTHQCDCSNGNSNMPVCTSTSSGSSSSGSAGHGRSSSQYSTKAAALKGIQDGLNQSLTIDYGAIERSNQKQMDAAQRLEDAQLAAQQAEEARRRTAATVPLGRIGRPDDIAGALLFLWATLADFGYKRCGDDPSVLLPALLSPRKGGYDLCGCRNRASACCRRRCRLCRSRRRNNVK